MADEEIWKVLTELDTINRFLGGYQVTLKALSELLTPTRSWHILDVGCGGGDNLRVISQWAEKKGLNLKLTGLDINPACLEYAQKMSKRSSLSKDIEWIACDYRDWNQPVDLIVSSLFCHHLDALQFQEFLQWTKNTAGYAFLINDLHRHPLAWSAISILTRILSRSRLVQYDAPLSVARSFTRSELQTAFSEAGLQPQIHWRWAFRYLVMGYV